MCVVRLRPVLPPRLLPFRSLALPSLPFGGLCVSSVFGRLVCRLRRASLPPLFRLRCPCCAVAFAFSCCGVPWFGAVPPEETLRLFPNPHLPPWRLGLPRNLGGWGLAWLALSRAVGVLVRLARQSPALPFVCLGSWAWLDPC